MRERGKEREGGWELGREGEREREREGEKGTQSRRERERERETLLCTLMAIFFTEFQHEKCSPQSVRTCVRVLFLSSSALSHTGGNKANREMWTLFRPPRFMCDFGIY